MAVATESGERTRISEEHHDKTHMMIHFIFLYKKTQHWVHLIKYHFSTVLHPFLKFKKKSYDPPSQNCDPFLFEGVAFL